MIEELKLKERELHVKILFVDHEQVSAELAKAHLAPVGHEVVYEPSKAAMMPHIESETYDVVMLDPAPMKDPRSLILDIRQNAVRYPYIIWASEDAQPEAKKSGANHFLSKPLDKAALDDALDHAAALIKLVTRIGDISEDFPSAGGVISKSAFNQLFLSAMDRATRYGEASYVLFISIENYADIAQKEGHSEAEVAVAKLSQALVKLRRQSDIIGQTGVNEYALLLQRPVYESEPMDAANRFIQSLGDMSDLFEATTTSSEIGVRLMSVPDGHLVISHDVTKKIGE